VPKSSTKPLEGLVQSAPEALIFLVHLRCICGGAHDFFGLVPCCRLTVQDRAAAAPNKH